MTSPLRMHSHDHNRIATLIVDRDYRRVLAHSDSAIVLQKGLVELSGSAEHVASDSALTKLLGV